MKSNIKNFIAIIFSLIFVFNFATPFAFAEGNPALDPSTDVVKSFDGGGLVPCGRGGSAECNWNDLIILANRVVTFLVWLSVSLAVMAFCYAGFLYMTAFGESGKIEQAHGIFKSAITGILFVLCGWLIIATILKVLVNGDEANIGSIVPFEDVETIQGQPR